MDADVCQERLDRIRDRSGGTVLGFLDIFASGKEFTQELVSFAALGFGCLRWRVAGKLALSLFALPPLDEVGAGTLVPNVARAVALERNESPDS